LNDVNGKRMRTPASGAMDKIASRIFDLDSRIRYVGIVDMQYRVLVSQMRPGVTSLTDTEKDRHFLSIVPRIMIEGAEKLEPDSGVLDFVTARYKKVMVDMYRFGQHIVMLTFDASLETPFSSNLLDRVGRILAEDVPTPLLTDLVNGRSEL
jgi:hypothetical protein